MEPSQIIRGKYSEEESGHDHEEMKDKELVLQLIKELNMVKIKNLINLLSINYIDDRDILKGSYGVEVDALIGKSPINGPDGYTFRKITYSAISANAIGALFTYKLDRLSRGVAHAMSAVPARADSTINADQAGGAGITTDNKLVTGDIILAAILRVEDGRNTNVRQGTMTGSIMSGSATTVNASNIAYGIFPNSTDQQSVQHQYGVHVKTVSTSATPVMAVCTSNFNVKTPIVFSTTVSHTDISAPILSIGIGGFATNTDAPQVRVTLTVYALCGPRPNGMANVPKDPAFRMELLETFNVKNPVVTGV